ncbi:MAG TPA: MFS transporter [Actinomycetota bacterium]|nr:MFS transporter [Actinomycetota bacterium]
MSDIVETDPLAEGATQPSPSPLVGKPGRLRRLLKRTPQEPLGHNYRKLWVASAISNLGDGVRLTALPLMAAEITRDPAQIAAIDLASTLPWFLFALLAGAFVDRVDRRHAMGIANIIRAILVGALALSVLADNATLVLLYVVAFLLGCAETVYDNANQAILPSLVRKDQLERANGRMYAAEFTTNQFAGPPLGAFLFVTAASAPFFLDSASFLIAALLVLSFSGSFKAPRDVDVRRTTMRADIAEGLRWLWNHKLLRTLAIMLGTWNALNTAAFSIFVLFALEILDVTEVGYGILISSLVVGSVAGSLAGSAVSRLLGPGTTLLLSVLSGAALVLVIALTSNPYVVGAMFAVEGFVTVVWNVITVSMRQTIIPDRLLGRVNSVYRLFGWGSMPIGAALGGFLGTVFGLRAPYFVMAAVLAVMALITAPLVNNRTIAAAKAAATE